MKRYLVIVSLILCCHSIFGQNSVPTPLKIGDHCPDILFAELLESGKPSSKLSDFKGKPVILDFWATYCAPCIKALPVTQAIQKKYPDKIKILLVGADKRNLLERYYQSNPFLKLTTAVINHTHKINKLFPHNEIPFSVWLDADHVVRAFGDYETLTESNVLKLINKQPILTNLKKTEVRKGFVELYDSVRTASSASPDTLTFYKSEILHYDADYDKRYMYVGPQFKNRVLDRSGKNYTIALLYGIAYGGWDKGVQLGTRRFDLPNIIVESRDTFKIADPREYLTTAQITKRFGSDFSGRTWFRQNSYCYRLVLPKPDSAKLFQIMQRDLLTNFGYVGSVESRAIKSIVLKSTGPIVCQSHNNEETLLMVSTKGVDVRNCNIKEVLAKLQQNVNGTRYGTRRYMPYFDESGIKVPVTVRFSINDLSNLTELNAALAKYNLEIILEDRPVNVLIIKDADK